VGWNCRHTFLPAHVFICHLSLLSAAEYQACHPPSTHTAPGPHRANCPLPTHSLLGHLQWVCARAHHYVFLLRAPSIATLTNVRDKKCVAKIKWAGSVNTSVPRLGANIVGVKGR
jgi:hypothetical protein